MTTLSTSTPTPVQPATSKFVVASSQLGHLKYYIQQIEQRATTLKTAVTNDIHGATEEGKTLLTKIETIFSHLGNVKTATEDAIAHVEGKVVPAAPAQPSGSVPPEASVPAQAAPGASPAAPKSPAP